MHVFWFGQAMEHYHIALSLNEGNKEAQTGLDRLEKLIKDIDPDMISDDDVEGGHIETGNGEGGHEFL